MDFSRHLPAHTVLLKNGDHMERPCPSGDVDEVEEDVGLITAKCPSCTQYFVYNFRKSLWIPEEDFEKELQNHPPKLTSAV